MKRIFLLLLGLTLMSTFELSAQNKEGTIYMVSNAHFDSQWNWDVQTSIGTYVRNTLTQNLWLLDHDPDYIFNFEGGIKYSWMKEYYPADYERVKAYVKSGRWHISGASWDATDPNIPSTESFMRSILLGQQYYKDEFGVKSTDIFLPDCFGFGYTLPTIAAHCGLIGFSTQKLQWRNRPFYGESKVPFLFGLWEGVDGSRIAAALDARSYTQQYDNVDLTTDREILDIVNSSPNKKGYRYYGVGDIGGSPTIPSVESVTTSMRAGKGAIRVVSATSDQLFKEYLPYDAHAELPLYKGELLMDVHATGCYTSQSAMKRYNRRNEQLADAAERASVMADWCAGAAYPQEKLTAGWRRFVWHQFHDDLTGTSIPRAYEFSWNDELLSQSQFNDVLTYASSRVAAQLDTRVKGRPVVVFNPLSQTRCEIVRASIPMATKPAAVKVYGADGKSCKAQLLSYADGQAEVLFTATVEPMSYAVYDVQSAARASLGTLKVGDNWLENAVYKVVLDANGDIASITDKRNGQELVRKETPIRLALIKGNESASWPAWEVSKRTIDNPATSVTEDVRITVAEQGAARVALKVERRYKESRFVQYIFLTDGAADDRIDVLTEIDWRQTDALLKAEFPLSFGNSEATYDLGIGSIKRGNNTPIAYEVYAQQWADLTKSDNSYGVSILNDCKYGWDKPNDHTLRLTLLHTPSTRQNYSYQNRQDLGHHTMTYSIVGHPAGYVDAGIVRKAEAMNNPLFAYNTPQHAGVLGKRVSMVTNPSPNVDIKTFKRAESDQDFVIRLYETAGRSDEQIELEFASPIEAAVETNGIEESIGEAVIAGNKLYLKSQAFRPRTFKVKLAKCGTNAKQPCNKVVMLPYNAQGYTSDAFRELADFDGAGNAYTYDLLPRNLVSEGVPFQFGKFGSKNIVKCKGDTITLPADHRYHTMYLLVAATDKDKVAPFRVEGRIYERQVPYYSGFFGQWGWDGKQSYVKDASVAWVGTHRHNKERGNEPYVYTYMYKIALPLCAESRSVVLPDDQTIAVFAATLSEEQPTFTPAAEYRVLP